MNRRRSGMSRHRQNPASARSRPSGQRKAMGRIDKREKTMKTRERLVAETIHAEAKRTGSKYVAAVTYADGAESIFFFPTLSKVERFGRELKARIPDVEVHPFKVM